MAHPPLAPASRIRGSLYGVAVCDALGAPVEFCARGTFPPITDGFQYNPNFDLAPGCWTDDTSMTLCLAQSLVDRAGAFDARDQVGKYVKWYEEGYMSSVGKCFDIGNATRNALAIWREYLKGAAAATGEGEGMEGAQKAVDARLKKKVQCGNGALMRVAPVGLVFYRDEVKAVEYAGLSSQVTHPYPTNAEACVVYTKLVAATFTDKSKADLASIVADWAFDDPDLKSRFEKYRDLRSWKEVKSDRISSSGYVVHSLEASLWGFFTTESFEEGALKVINLGDDADTVGAIYGGIAGAFYGVEAIPQKWLSELEAKDIVDAVVEGVVALVGPG
ncbi:MAG: hypothetical protein LQ346_006610 [Caloplaca aetnensis]|nr:MAG: hypothetical protein LQ346_006610 [Caloplaca aetnensis]